MKQNKKLIFILVLFVLFVNYYFISNDLVVMIYSKKYELNTVRSVDNLYVSNTEGFAEITDYRQRNDLLRVFDLSGYVAVPTVYDNTNKSAKLLLVNEQHSYEIDGYLIYSTELNNHFNTTGLKGEHHLFKTEFSTIPIKNGIYDVYIFDRENEHNYGLISFSNLVLEKREDGLYTYYPPEIEQIESNNYNSMDVFFYHRDVLSENGYYALKGVAFKQGLDSKNSELYIEVDMDDNSSHTFKATLLPDYWYNRISGSDLYTLSGFIAYIPQDILDNKTVRLKFIIKNEGVYSYKDYCSFFFNGSSCEPVYVQECNINHLISVHADTTYVLWNGLSFLNNDNCLFNGYIYIDKNPIDNPEIYLQFKYSNGDTITYPAFVYRNEWVASDMGEEYANCSYGVKIAADDFRHEDVDVYVLISDGVHVYNSEEPIHYVWQDEQFVRK
jgi:hypothetical protein